MIFPVLYNSEHVGFKEVSISMFYCYLIGQQGHCKGSIEDDEDLKPLNVFSLKNR